MESAIRYFEAEGVSIIVTIQAQENEMLARHRRVIDAQNNDRIHMLPEKGGIGLFFFVIGISAVDDHDRKAGNQEDVMQGLQIVGKDVIIERWDNDANGCGCAMRPGGWPPRWGHIPIWPRQSQCAGATPARQYRDFARPLKQ